MNKSEDLREIIAKVRRIEIITDHNKTQLHSNEQFPLASKTLPSLSHTACILTPLAKPNTIEQCNFR